jgi:hypothetical protein
MLLALLFSLAGDIVLAIIAWHMVEHIDRQKVCKASESDEPPLKIWKPREARNS